MANAEVVSEEDLMPEWTFGDRLRKAREHAGLDQGEIAQRLAVSDGSVSNWEKGRSLPRGGEVKLAQKWSAETGVPVAWLLGLVARSRCFYVVRDEGQMELPYGHPGELVAV